ncbi:hypothetical protein Tco_1183519 [Tanacetum coccineum]
MTSSLIASGSHLLMKLFLPKAPTDSQAFKSYQRSSYDRSLIEVWADVELKDHIMVAMPKLVEEGFYTCTIHFEYEWKPPMYACCKIFGHIQDECLKNIDSDVVKNMKKPNQATRGVPVGPKATIMDDEVKPLRKVDSLGGHDSDDEVASVDNDMTNCLDSKKVGYGTNSLLEQWKESYENDDYDFDPYDDDMYEGQNIPNKI